MQATEQQDLIDQIVKEGPIGPTQAATFFGQFRRNGATQRSTVMRWMLDGIRLPDGRRVKLDNFRLGSRLMTSRERCLAFIRAQQNREAETEEPTHKGGKKKRVNPAREAGRRLASLGA